MIQWQTGLSYGCSKNPEKTKRDWLGQKGGFQGATGIYGEMQKSGGHLGQAGVARRHVAYTDIRGTQITCGQGVVAVPEKGNPGRPKT